METISQLRKICQTTRESPIYQMNWMDKNILRRLSIYFTRIFINRKLTANQVTGIDFLIVLAAGMYFTLPYAIGWLVGLLCFLLYMVIDCSDGEVARYYLHKGKGTGLPFGVGAVLGGVVDWFVWAFMFACMSFGVYSATGNDIVFVFGFLCVIMRYLYMDMGLMPYPILHEKGVLSQAISKIDGKPTESKLMALGRFAFGAQGFTLSMLVVIIIDMFIPVFHINGFAMNTRFIYLIGYGVAAGIGVYIKIKDVYKRGVRIQRI